MSSFVEGQLVGGDVLEPAGVRLHRLGELFGRADVGHQPDAVGGGRVDGVARQQELLGVLQPEPVHPQHGGGRAEDTRRRVADVGVGSHEQQIAAQDQVGGPTDGPAVDLAQHRLGALPDLHEPFDVLAHELVVPHGIPGARPGLGRGGVIRARPGVLDGGRVGRVVDAVRSEVVAGGENPARAADDDRAHGLGGSGRINAVGHPGDHRLGERVEALRTVQGDDRDAALLGVVDRPGGVALGGGHGRLVRPGAIRRV